MRIGIDIVEVDRLRMKLENNPRLKNRFFTREEIEYCQRFSDPWPHLAGTFAAKEAVIKALGRNPGWKKIEIIRKEDGSPVVHLHGNPLPSTLSISHTSRTAVAVFLLLKVI